MVTISDTLSTATQLAQTVQGATNSITPIAQNILAAGQAAGASLHTQASNLWFKFDAAGSMLVRAADGSYLPLDELMNGPILPRVAELGNLIEKSEQLFDLATPLPLAHLVDCKVEELVKQLSPAEMVQMVLRGEVHEFSGNISVSPFAIGPDGKQVNIGDLETMPLYPSVEGRLTWLDRVDKAIRNDDDALFHFCDLKDDLLAAKMSEAEEVQFWLVWWNREDNPAIDLPKQFTDASGRAWTLEELKKQPVPPIVSTLKKWNTVLEQMGERFESSEAAAIRARIVLEGYAMYQQMERLLPQLSDAELLQFCMS